jgi:hypothetical protein
LRAARIATQRAGADQARSAVAAIHLHHPYPHHSYMHTRALAYTATSRALTGRLDVVNPLRQLQAAALLQVLRISGNKRSRRAVAESVALGVSCTAPTSQRSVTQPQHKVWGGACITVPRRRTDTRHTVHTNHDKAQLRAGCTQCPVRSAQCEVTTRADTTQLRRSQHAAPCDTTNAQPQHNIVKTQHSQSSNVGRETQRQQCG